MRTSVGYTLHHERVMLCCERILPLIELMALHGWCNLQDLFDLRVTVRGEGVLFLVRTEGLDEVSWGGCYGTWSVGLYIHLVEVQLYYSS